MAMHPADNNLWVVGWGKMSQSDRCLEGASHLEIPDGLAMVTELDFQYGPICKNLRTDEER